MALPVEYATDLAVSTFNEVADKSADNYFSRKNFLKFFMARGKVTYEGGLNIVRPIEYRGNPNVQWSDKDTVLKVDQQDVLTAAKYPWRHQTGTVVFDDFAPELNQGPAQILSFVDVQLANLNKSLEQDLERALLQDGGVIRTKSIQSIGSLFSDVVFGGIDSATEPWWKPYSTADRGASDPVTRKLIHGLYNSISRGAGEHPDCILTNSEVYQDFSNIIWEKERMQPANVNGIDLQVKGFMFEEALFMWTDNAALEMTTDAAGVQTASTKKNPIYMLNFDYLELVCHAVQFLSMVRPTRLPTIPKTNLLLESTCALVCSGRKFQGRSWQTK